MEEKRFCLIQNANFLFTDKREVISLSNSHGIPRCYTVATSVISINKNNTTEKR